MIECEAKTESHRALGHRQRIVNLVDIQRHQLEDKIGKEVDITRELIPVRHPGRDVTIGIQVRVERDTIQTREIATDCIRIQIQEIAGMIDILPRVATTGIIEIAEITETDKMVGPVMGSIDHL